MNIVEQVNALKNNPMQFFLQNRIPQEYMNDPEGAIKHMVETGQISQQMVEMAKSRARMMGFNV